MYYIENLITGQFRCSSDSFGKTSIEVKEEAKQTNNAYYFFYKNTFYICDNKDFDVHKSGYKIVVKQYSVEGDKKVLSSPIFENFSDLDKWFDSLDISDSELKLYFICVEYLCGVVVDTYLR